ncbi:MAG TPA: hypothetical protein VFQ17_03025 [Nocardioides sp.]|nr:hypothetical protein [Nocardioides sp.]
MLDTLIALPYQLARLPLTVVDKTLVGRLSATSVPRVTLDRVIGSADKLAGEVLGNDDIAQRGVDRIERSDKLLTAARLEQEAQTLLGQASQTAAAGRQQATRTRHKAKDRAASGLVAAESVQARGKQKAKATATRRASAKKAAADHRAASRTTAIEGRKDRVDSTAETKKKSTQRSAKTKLDEARKTRQSAAEARADAKRLSDLAQAKKQTGKRA